MRKTISKPIDAVRTGVPLKMSTTPYQRALDAAKALSLQETIDLIETLKEDTRASRRALFLAETGQSLAEHARGEQVTGSVEELIKALNERRKSSS